ncbi:MAG: carboxypeptidase-like regulatory domain-containing protein, partial [Cyclobacteriaceae bacterium]|nr:carboxypeptidase-like regulatory domain-containing protein [Cyclobacteriaceae bacterium]
MFKNLKLLTLLTFIVFTGCKKDKNIPAPEGILSGLVTDAGSATGIEGVTIIVFDATNNLPVGSTVITDATGNYSVTLTPGNYYLKAYSQGYQEVPPKGITPLSFSVVDGQTTDNPFSMFTSAVVNGGFISGNVGQGGVLVIANDGVNGYSTISDENGNYTIFNVPAGTYTVNGFSSGFNGAEVTNTSVTANTETPNVDIVMTAGATGSVSGQVTFLATGNIEVDVALIDVYTKEVIP